MIAPSEPLDRLEGVEAGEIGFVVGFGGVVSGARGVRGEVGFSAEPTEETEGVLVGAVSWVGRLAFKKESRLVSLPSKESRSPNPSKRSSCGVEGLLEEVSGWVVCEFSFFDEVMMFTCRLWNVIEEPR